MSSHTLELVTVGLFLMADMTSAQGLCASFKRQAITLVETTLTTWTEFEGLSVAHNFAGGQE